MKKKSPVSTENKKNSQDNIGYQNTEKENDQDNLENNRVQTTDTGHGEGPKDKDSKGLRSESGANATRKKK